LESNLEQNSNPQFVPEYYILEYKDWLNGTYYFIIIAFNEYGNYTSNCVKLVIGIPTQNDNKENEQFESDNSKSVNYWNYIIPIIFFSLLGLLIIIRKLKTR